MNRKQQKILDSIFETPTRAGVKFSDIGKLLIAIGGQKLEGHGSRVAYIMPDGRKWEAHKPHPQKEARKYQVESVRELLQALGYGK